jgi:hypothetical protein
MKVRRRRDRAGIRILLIAAMFATLFGAVATLFDYMLAPLRPRHITHHRIGSAAPAAIYMGDARARLGRSIQPAGLIRRRRADDLANMRRQVVMGGAVTAADSSAARGAAIGLPES